MMLMRVSLQLPLLDPATMARDVSTRLRWSRRLSMTRLSSVITPTTGGATPPTQPTTSPSRRRSARRTSGRTALSTMRRLPSTRPFRCAEHPLSKTVRLRDPRSVEPSMSLSAGPNRRSMMWRMTLLSVRPSRTEYESECWTKQEEHDVEDDVVECETIQDEKCEDETSGYTTETKCTKWPREVCNVNKKSVKKYTPITGCTKEPRELCAPAGCGFKEGAEVCYDKTQTVVQDAPKEECSLEPQRTCAHVTKLVPKLEPPEECVDVPKEVRTRSKSNPRKVKKPVVKKWCYVPTEESGLA